jgi:hypothetical protein
VRQAQGRKLGLQRSFGAAPTAAWSAFRQVIPWQEDYTQRPLDVPATQLAYAFLQANPASLFYPPAAGHPAVAARVRVAVRTARRSTARYAQRINRHQALRRFIRRQARN